MSELCIKRIIIKIVFIENSKIVRWINDEASAQLIAALGFKMESFIAFDFFTV